MLIPCPSRIGNTTTPPILLLRTFLDSAVFPDTTLQLACTEVTTPFVDLAGSTAWFLQGERAQRLAAFREKRLLRERWPHILARIALTLSVLSGQLRASCGDKEHNA